MTAFIIASHFHYYQRGSRIELFSASGNCSYFVKARSRVSASCLLGATIMSISIYATRTRRRLVALGIMTGALLLYGATDSPDRAGATAGYLQTFPEFNPAVSAQLPGDVDVDLKHSLEAKQQFALVQREFDLYSWQMFFALNWPTDARGRPAPALGATSFGPPKWSWWHTSPQIFRADGARPTACNKRGQLSAPRPDLSKPLFAGLGRFPAAAAAANPQTTRFLGIISAVGNVHVNTPFSDIQQAFTGPLIDQNGEFVYYEIIIDPNEVDYLCANDLYNINGQVAFSNAGGKVEMPSGLDSVDSSGAFELKIAWKVLGKNDDPDRFFTMDGYIKDEATDNSEIDRQVKLGMVGLHIAHKSASSPQWIWSTFEQVDNLATNPVSHPQLNPSFHNPGCELCAVNVLPVAGSDGVYPRIPVQAWRSVPLPLDKQALNDQVRAAMAKSGSVWQYYQLIDTQWPTQPQVPPADPSGPLPAAVANKSGGNATPVYLTNITMETYFQGGNTLACHQTEGNPGCNLPGFLTSNGSVPPNPPAAAPAASTTIFASESCMGCHSSAGIYTSYDPANPAAATQSGQLSGDFSWLMAQKANWQQQP